MLLEKQDLSQYSSIFSRLCSELRLSLKILKNEEGNRASLEDVELDTERLVIRLAAKKLQKAKSIVDKAQNAQSASLVELQRVTGFLNFASIVIPLGRTLLRRLYNMQLYFTSEPKQIRRRLSSEAQKDLAWWAKSYYLPRRGQFRWKREI